MNYSIFYGADISGNIVTQHYFGGRFQFFNWKFRSDIVLLDTTMVAIWRITKRK